MPPLIFLAGPPGSGKTSLGRRACQDLALRFLELPPGGAASIEAVIDLVSASADVVELSWEMQQDPATLRHCRQRGLVVALWAHPQEMQARSGQAAPLFTPVSRLTTHGGFGRRGTGCPEFRRLDRACDQVLMLVGFELDEAEGELKDLIEDLRLPEANTPAQREGLDGWAEEWRSEYRADRKACELLVDAMARYTLHLKEKGASPRKMSGVYSDLNAAGLLVMMYGTPKGAKVFTEFSSAPYTYEYERKFSDAPRAMARYESTLKGFAAFLREGGMIGDG